MSLTNTIMEALKGAAYMGENGLRDYHKAQAIKAALRCRDAHKRLSGVREALNQYRVSAWLTDDDHIRLVRDGKDIVTL